MKSLEQAGAAAQEMSEGEAIRLAQQGEATAFERLYELHSQRVHSLCLRIAGNRSDAEELTQETFMQLFRKISSFRGDSALSTWLHRMTINVALMSFRRKSLIDTSVEEMRARDKKAGRKPREFGYKDKWLNGVVDRIHLERLLDQLPSECRSMFVLRDLEGYQHREIAKILGCSVGNTKTQLHKARTLLRRLMGANPPKGRARMPHPPITSSFPAKSAA